MVIHFFSDTGDILRKLFGNKIAPLDDVSLNPTGSNGFAFRKQKTADNKTLKKPQVFMARDLGTDRALA